MSKSNQSFMIIGIIFLMTLCSCENPPPFAVPSEFQIEKHDPSKDQILALTYNNEMMITVSEHLSKVVKESMFFGTGPMKIAFEAKFPTLVEKFNGENISKQTHYFINDNLYMHQSFEYNDGETEGYYEYGAMHIKEPEAYYEFFISGDKSKQGAHRDIINKLLKAIP